MGSAEISEMAATASQRDAVPPLRANEWDQFLCASSSATGFKQSSWWAEFLASRGWGHFGQVYSDDSGLVGGARVLIKMFAPGQFCYYVPHGPVLPDDQADAKEVFELFLEDVGQRRRQEQHVVSHLRLEPRWELLPDFVHGYEEAMGWTEPRDTLYVDLAESADAILAQMKPKGRYNIRLAQRKGVTVVADHSDRGVGDFFDLYDSTLRRHGTRGHSREYIQALAATLFERERGSILFAEYDGLRLAAALVVYFGDTATYKYGGSQLTHPSVMAPYLLHYEAILGAKARGLRYYDFYGISAPDDTNNPWANFSSFKRKFGGREVHFVRTMDYVYDREAYAAYRARARAD